MTAHTGETAGVSAIVLAYNSELYLGEAISSILAQTVAPFQIIIINDGSTDGTREIAKGFGNAIEYVEPPSNQGIARTLNRGVGAARGEYVAFLDGDDVWSPDKLEKLLRAFEENPARELASGHVQHFISPEVSDAVRSRIVCPSEAMPGYVYGALLARREVFARVGLFGTQWRVGHFVDWYARAQEAGVHQIMLPDVVLHRRLHGENIGLREPAARRDFVLAVKAARDRRKKVSDAAKRG